MEQNFSWHVLVIIFIIIEAATHVLVYSDKYNKADLKGKKTWYKFLYLEPAAILIPFIVSFLIICVIIGLFCCLIYNSVSVLYKKFR